MKAESGFNKYLSSSFICYINNNQSFDI